MVDSLVVRIPFIHFVSVSGFESDLSLEKMTPVRRCYLSNRAVKFFFHFCWADYTIPAICWFFKSWNGSPVGSWLLVFMGGSSYISLDGRVPKGYSILSANLYLLKKRTITCTHQNTSRIINSSIFIQGVDTFGLMYCIQTTAATLSSTEIDHLFNFHNLGCRTSAFIYF